MSFNNVSKRLASIMWKIQEAFFVQTNVTSF